MLTSYTLKEVRRLNLSSRKTIEKDGSMISMSGEIMFAVSKTVRIGNADVSAWVYYELDRGRMERTVFYSSLKERMGSLSSRTLMKWVKPSEVSDDLMDQYRNFLPSRYDGSFSVRVRDNAVSQRVNRCGITIIAFTGDHAAEYMLSKYRKMDTVEKLFMSSMTFTGGEPVRVHGMDALRRDVREYSCNCHEIQDPGIHEIIRYTQKILIEKKILKLHNLKKYILLDGKKITTEIISKQKVFLKSIGIKPERLHTFLKSYGYKSRIFGLNLSKSM